jgi:hypothetical protein
VIVEAARSRDFPCRGQMSGPDAVDGSSTGT